MQPRRHLYQLAHVVICNDVHRRPEAVWAALTGPSWSDYLAMKWHEAAEGAPAAPVEGAGVEGVFQRAGWEILVLRMPPPAAPTEAFYVALARRPSNPASVGYFVMELGGAGAFVSEWRSDGSRIRQSDLPAPTLDAFLARLEEELAARGPDAFPRLGSFGPGPGGPGAFGPGPFGPGAGGPGGFGPGPGGPGPFGVPMMRSQLVAPGTPAKSSAGKWILIGIGALVLLFVASRVFFMLRYSFSDHSAQTDYARERAIEEQADDLDAKTKEAIAAARTARDACQKREVDAADKAFTKALPEGRPVAPKRPSPKTKARAAAAMLFSEVKDKLGPGVAYDRDVFKGSPWVSAAETHCSADSASQITEIEEALKKRPYRYGPGSYEQNIAGWTADVQARTAALQKSLQSLSSVEAPQAAFRVDDHCTTRAVTSFTSNITGQTMTIDAYSCKVVAVWVSVPEGEVLAAAVGQGSGAPVDPGELVSADAISSANSAARRKAIEQARASIKTQLNGWGAP